MNYNEDGLEEHGFYTAIIKSADIGGADALLTGIAATVAILSTSLVGTITGGVIAFVGWVLVYARLRAMGKKDPYMRRVYLRYLNYNGKYYPAKAGLYSRRRSLPASWL